MSEYQRNRGMVVCVIAVLAVGAITVGGLTYLGSTGWWGIFGWNSAKTTFLFEGDVGNITGTMLLDVDLSTGGLSLHFVDNSTLLYEVSFEVQNSTLNQYGLPTVALNGNRIVIDYSAAGVNVTLGTGVSYAINASVATGGISAIIDHGAHLANISLTTTTGGVSLLMTDQVVVSGSAPIDLRATTGGITLNVDLPSSAGGSFVGSSSLGGVHVNTASWTQIAQNHYETANYHTASDTVTIVATTSTGGMSANLS
jgi:hypothetical protein